MGNELPSDPVRNRPYALVQVWHIVEDEMPDVELVGMDVVASELRNHASGLGYVVVERVLNRSQNLRVARADLTVQGLGCFLDQ